MVNKEHVGSTFDSWLEEEGFDFHRHKFGKTLCQSHLFTLGHLKQLKLRLKKTELKNDPIVFLLINTCMEEIRVSKKIGQIMENRMKKYRKAIEGLGFKRARKNG